MRLASRGSSDGIRGWGGEEIRGEEVILARVEERGVHRGGVFVRCDLGGRLGMWEAAGNNGEIGEAELRK